MRRSLRLRLLLRLEAAHAHVYQRAPAGPALWPRDQDARSMGAVMSRVGEGRGNPPETSKGTREAAAAAMEQRRSGPDGPGAAESAANRMLSPLF